MKGMTRVIAALVIAVMVVSGIAALAEGLIRTTGTVNLRAGAGLGYAKRDTISRGETLKYDKVSRDGRGVTWYRVTRAGKTGWASSRYSVQVNGGVKALSASVADAEDSVVTAISAVYIRKGPGLGYDAVNGMQKGRTAAYLNEKHVDERGVTWYKVKFNGSTGWVSSKYAKLG